MSISTTTCLALAVLLLIVSDKALAQSQRPNFIVMQPDDLAFFEEWTPPAHYPNTRRNGMYTYEQASQSATLPNIHRLMTEGCHMTQAYAASAMCGTSRYSTMTGRYPSRAASARRRDDGVSTIGQVTIPRTKILDNSYGNDCSHDNLAMLLQKNGYRTGVVGKWHLSPDTVGTNDGELDYQTYRNSLHQCGWEYAEAIYPENLGEWSNNLGMSHNMEHVAFRGTEFIAQTVNDPSDNRPFFLYFNPTANHGSGDIYEALTQYSCRDTVEGTLGADFDIPGMTEGSDCIAYRQSVIDRAVSHDAQSVGSIWIDDAVGALLTTLERTGQLDNTFFLFQMDHGSEGKSSQYEPGVRIAQFIHYPDMFAPGSSFDGVVSTIDIAATIMEYAGLDENSPGHYEMDGSSWKNAVETFSPADTYNYWRDERCIAFELDTQRAVRCGCAKYSYDMTAQFGPTINSDGVVSDLETLFNLCGEEGSKTALTSASSYSPEEVDVQYLYPDIMTEMRAVAQSHITRTEPALIPDFITPLYAPTDLDFGFTNVVNPTTTATTTATTPTTTSTCSQVRESCQVDDDCCNDLVCGRRNNVCRNRSRLVRG